MTLLEQFFFLSGLIILILAIRVARKSRFNALYFLVFLGVGVWLIISSLFPGILNRVGDFFWIDRGAYVFVYVSIIFLFYFSLLLLRKIDSWKTELTQLIREIAIRNRRKQEKNHSMVTFVVAAYNEEKSIEKTVRNIFNNGYDSVIVVNDGSKDTTGDILEKLADEYPGLTVLHHYKNRWQWSALETGFEYLRRQLHTSEYVVTYDADGQHDIIELPQFLDILWNDESIDIALWSRFLSKKPKNMPFMRRVILRLGILFTFFISHIRLSDTHNGYRVFRSRILKDLRITLDGMGHASEILDIVAEKKLKYVEIPVTIHYTEETLAKWQKSSNAVWIALRMIWKKFFS